MGSSLSSAARPAEEQFAHIATNQAAESRRLARREQFHQSRLVEHLGSWNPFYNGTLSRIQDHLNGRAANGSSSGTSMAVINHMVQSQAAILAYIDVFVALGVIALVMVLLALTLRSVNRSSDAKPTH